MATDKQIKRINSKIDTILQTLGPDSELYNNTIAAVNQIIGNSNLLISRDGEKRHISRTNFAYQHITDDQLDKLERWMSNHSLAKEKQKLREDIFSLDEVDRQNIFGALAPASKRGRVGVGAYRLMAEMRFQMAHDIQTALNWFYDYEGNSEEAQSGLAIMRQSKKSYAELQAAMGYYKKGKESAIKQKLSPERVSTLSDPDYAERMREHQLDLAKARLERKQKYEEAKKKLKKK